MVQTMKSLTRTRTLTSPSLNPYMSVVLRELTYTVSEGAILCVIHEKQEKIPQLVP
jgi:hypothetical protein